MISANETARNLLAAEYESDGMPSLAERIRDARHEPAAHEKRAIRAINAALALTNMKAST